MNMSHTTARTGVRARQLLALAVLGLTFAVAAAPASAANRPASLDGVVNINTASSEELQLLPGVGKVRAEAIVARRQQSGGFKSIDELKQVKGIGDAMLERMRPHVSLTGKTTARPATSDESKGKGKGAASSGAAAKR